MRKILKNLYFRIMKGYSFKQIDEINKFDHITNSKHLHFSEETGSLSTIKAGSRVPNTYSGHTPVEIILFLNT